jgi:hypothetical protein
MAFSVSPLPDAILLPRRSSETTREKSGSQGLAPQLMERARFGSLGLLARYEPASHPRLKLSQLGFCNP